MSDSATPQRLRGSLTLWPGALYGVGVAIGAGIYMLVGIAGRSGMQALLAFVLAALPLALFPTLGVTALFYALVAWVAVVAVPARPAWHIKRPLGAGVRAEARGRTGRQHRVAVFRAGCTVTR